MAMRREKNELETLNWVFSCLKSILPSSRKTRRRARRGESSARLVVTRLEDRLAPATLHWLGSSAANGNLWSVAANWYEDAVPVSGDRLVFDTTTPGFSVTANGFAPTNDLSGLTNLAIGINDSSAAGDFTISGNAFGLVTTVATGITSTLSVGTAATISNNLTLGANTTIAVGLGSLTLGGVITGAFSLTDAGSPASTLTLNAANNYSGGTTLTSGTLSVNTNTSLGTGTLTFNGGTLSDAQSFLQLPNTFVVSAPSTIGGGGFFELDGNGTLNATLSLDNTGFLTLDGALSGPSGLSEIGFPGSTTLGGTAGNTFTGGTTIYSGGITLKKTAGVNALASPITLIDSFDSLTLDASDQINGSTSVYLGQGSTFSTNGFSDSVTALTGLGALDTGSNATMGLTVTGGGSQLLTGKVSGSGLLTYNGAGSLTLAGASTSYSGTLTAAGGVLIVAADFSGATADVTGGTLEGTGEIKSITATSGIVDPDTAGTPSTLNTAASAVASSLNGATFRAVIGAPGPSDELALGANATLNLNGANLVVTASLGSSFETSYQIITSATGGLSGAFNSYANGSTITVGSQNFRINYTTNAVTLTNLGGGSQSLHWTGAASSNWSAAGNWVEDIVPASGDTLVFDTSTPGFAATTAAYAPTNDLNGLTNIALVINDGPGSGNFTLGGNSLGLVTTAGIGVSSTLATGTSATINNNLTLAANTTVNIGLGTLTLAGTIGGAFSLTETGSPVGILDVNGANSYSGGTILNAGTVSVNTNTSLGSGTITLSGGTLANSTAFLHVANPIVVSTLSTFGGGSFLNLDGNITLNANLRLTNSGFLTLDGAISGTGGLIEDGFPGSTTLSGSAANTYTGATTILGGSIALDKTAGVNAIVSPITIAGGGSFPTLSWGASNQLNGKASVTLGINGTLNTSGYSDTLASLSGIGTVTDNTNNGGTGLTVAGGSGAMLLTGPVNGSGLLTYNGSGSLSLTLGGNSSSFTGQLIAAGGSLLVLADFSGATAETQGSGTLGGTGIVKTLAASSSGTINPGGSGVAGILSTAGGTLASVLSGETFQADITDTGLSDQLVIGDSSTINLSNATLSVNVLHATFGSVYTLISSATGGITGTFTSLPDGSTFTAAGRQFKIHYTANAVTLTNFQGISLSPSSLPAGEAGVTYNQTIVPVGGTAPVTLAVSNITNTTGLTISGSGSGTISLTGAPTSAGTVTFTVTPTDANGTGTGTNYSITINPPVLLGPATLPAGEVAIPYSQTITSTGGTAPVTLAVSGVTNTTGLTISGSGTGTISLAGTPTSAGSVTFTVNPTDAVGVGAGKTYSFVVNSAVAMGPTTLPGGKVGIAYSQSITSTGGAAPVTLAVSAITNTTGVIISGSGSGTISLSGMPTSTGTVTFTVTPSDAVGTAPSKIYSFVVQQPTSFSSLSSPSISFGTTSTQISGQLVPNPSTPLVPAGETVQVKLNGITQNATLDATDHFSTTFATAALGVTGSPYAISFTYLGDANFVGATGGSTLAVTQATPTITWSNPADIAYGTPLGATQLDAAASTGGTFTYTLADDMTAAAGAILQVGASQALNVSFTPTDANDFTAATRQVTINVNPKTLTVSLIGDPTKTYDGTTTAMLTPANFQLIGLVGSDSFAVTQTSGTYNSKDTSAGIVSAFLSPSNFTAGAGTLAADYVMPTTASGIGAILAQTLTAAIVGDPTKIYDGTTAATLTPANFQLSGLLPGESLIVTQTLGAYDSKDTSAATVSAILAASNFTAGSGTLASDYALPTAASGAGTIVARTLTAAIIGDPIKTYDGTTAATLTPANFQLSGLAGSDGFTLTQTAGAYNSKDTNAGSVSTALSPSNFTAGAGTLASDYTLPTTASGPGTILAKTLTASIIGDPTKIYDGTTTVTLTPANFQLNGLVGSDGFTISQTAGAYNSKDTTAIAVNASLSPSNFSAGAGTPASDYALPTSASGPGTIVAESLTVSIVGDPTKPYDGTIAATLTPANFQLTGLLPGEALNVTQTAGTYDSPDTSAAAVSAILSASNFSAGTGTLARDYVLPTTASGPGTIVAKALTASIIGAPTKTYDGTTTAVLTPANFQLNGLAGSDSFTILQTAGTYDSKDTSAVNVTALLTPSDFTVGAGTPASDYTLPTVATGPGTILAKTLTISILGDPTKTYDGTTAATLTPANFQLTGLVGSESLSVTQTAGTYNSPDTNAAAVSAILSASNFTASPGTLAADYALPTTASGAGTILVKTLTASILGDPTKAYDGTTAAALTPANFQLTGLVLGQSLTVTQTMGAYDSPDTSATIVSAILSASNFTAGNGTLASDYTLPTSASGAGTILAKTLTATIIGDPAKTYDGTTAATLTPANFQLTGLVGSDGFTVLQTAGVYNTKDTNAASVSAALSPGDFTIGAGTPASDYALPTTASGVGTILAKTLTAAIVGDPAKTYDGATAASLTPANFQLTGLVPGESLTVTQTAGAYNNPDTSAATVSATLSASNFSAGTGTLTIDYLLPTAASGAGAIRAKTLTASIVGDPTKTYDGTTAAALTPANFQLTGLIAGQSLTVTQTAGTYNSPDINAVAVSATLAPTNFTAGAGTIASDYALPTNASGPGTIRTKTLTATIIGDPAKTYDGTTAATLTPANFQLIGLVGGDGFTVTQTAGVYNSKDTGAASISAALSPSNFLPRAGTPASDYTLPIFASGPGTISPKTLTASIVGDPTKTYDGTPTATLTPANFQLTGLVGSESFTVTQTAGAYDGPDTSAAIVSAILSPGQFTAGPGTLASDYALPTLATGAGTITPASQSITFNVASTLTYGAPPITLTASGGASGNPVTFSIISGPGAVVGNTLSITGVGTIVIEADQAASLDYTAAPAVQRSVVAALATKTLSENENGALTAVTVSSVLGSHDSDADGANSKGGIAVFQVAGSGAWQYSTNGTTWIGISSPFEVPRSVGGVSPTNALLLPDGDSLRFVPAANWSGQANLYFVAWDGSQGKAGGSANITISGAATPFSTDVGTLALTVIPAPVWIGAGAALTPLLPGTYGSSNQTTPAGNTIASVFGNSFEDNNPTVSVGVAIESVTGSGVWQFLTTSGTTWTNFPAVSPTAALLLSAGDKVRFVPKNNFAGTATLKALAWDGSAGTDGATGNPAKLPGSAFSAATLTATASVNQAPTLSVPTLAPMTVVQYAASAAAAVSSLLTQAGYADPDGKGLPQGIAVAGTSSTVGTWQYMLFGGTWQPMPSVSPSSALLLPGNASFRFLAGNGIGSATLTFAGWDETQGVAGQFFDLVSPGGASAFSTAQGVLPINVNQSLNNAPILSVPTVSESAVVVNATGAAVTIGTLLTQGDYTDPDGGKLPEGIALIGAFAAGGTEQYLLPGGSWQPLPGVSSSSALLLPSGASLRLIAGNQIGTATLTIEGWDQTQGSAGQLFNIANDGGASAFSATETTASIPIVQAPSWTASTGATLTPLLPGAYSTSDPTSPPGNTVASVFGTFFLDSNPNLSVGVAVSAVTGNGTWQYSLTSGASWLNFAPKPSKSAAWLLSAADLIRFVPNTVNAGTATLTAYAWDGAGNFTTTANLTTTGTGGATPFSATTLVAVSSFNNAPTLATQNVSLPAVNENVNSPAVTAGSLLSKAGAADPDGKTVPAGIAVINDGGPGTWQWLNGSVWTALPNVSSAFAFLLPGSAQVRFQPTDNLPTNTRTSATLTYLAWDETAGAADTLFAMSGQAGASAFSALPAQASMTVSYVKQAPSWITGASAALTPVLGFSPSNPTPNPSGDTVAAVFSSAFHDAAGAQVAVAISAQTGTADGSWQYSTDDGSSWQNFPTTLSTKAALLLQADDLIRFVPSKTFSGPVTLTAYAWDGSGSFTGAVNLTQTGTGGATPFSSTTLIATCLVNSAPALT